MPDHYTQEEFDELMEPWDDKAKAIYRERMDSAPRTLEHFSESEAQIIDAILQALIPQQEDVDLVGFIDSTADKPLGRGDRAPGMPDTLDVIRTGLQGLEETAMALHGIPFRELSKEQIRALVPQLQSDQVPGDAWNRVPARYFFKRFYSRALYGYFAHPKAWMRIGFMGPSFPEGYAWTGRGQVQGRHDRTPGWERL